MISSPVADQRILRGTAATLAVQLADYEGEPAAPVGTLTVDITKADGTAVITGGATAGSSTDPRTYALVVADNATLELLVCAWKDGGVERARTYVDVVGGFYFSAAALEVFDSSLGDLNGSATPLAKMRRVRAEVERECEEITGTAWVRRYARVRVSGNGTRNVALPVWAPRTIRSVRDYTDATTYTAFSAGELAGIDASEGGVLTRTDGGVWPYGDENLVIEVEHGYDRPPDDLKHAAMTRFRYLYNAEKSGIPDRATSFTIADAGVFSLATAGRAGFETGIPEVDAVYGRRSVKIPGIA